MKTININIYQFAELSEQAKELAINDYINFEVEIMSEESPYFYLCEKMEKMRTPWFLGEVIYSEHKADIIETIETNEYYFFQDGEMANCTTYTGKHQKAGITELTFKGQIYTI